jgi:hypothetical protein
MGTERETGVDRPTGSQGTLRPDEDRDRNGIADRLEGAGQSERDRMERDQLERRGDTGTSTGGRSGTSPSTRP